MVVVVVEEKKMVEDETMDNQIDLFFLEYVLSFLQEVSLKPNALAR